MPVQLKVRPDIARKLTAIAKARGVSVDELLLAAINDLELSQDATNEPSLEEFEQDMDALADGLGYFPLKYEGSYSREDIYIDHD
jgi:hypothetical protein